MLPAFTCASPIGNVRSICSGVNILRPVPSIVDNGNIPLLEALRTISLLS